ncbi:hypothetical protein BABINDRAFT_38974 [Babjeviella inositovora NRRL Y-12698]|uniref:Uncharacterized protein n=1 Tax=Babjeviella inositovora NRRL Y-12698 TaxID=984486 RepID=A0A1E3QPF2_9ASCO|nr:uncharacterized protein BABINDRAFT_38974 [Babjeviella inositovora NRRL Y-12698]ODQ78857.1 hypothetical protein BABINDRAFT_38974 [Babjeviella inositovora NRRL Y-12698]
MFGCAFAVISKWIRDSGSDGADTGLLVGPFADATKRRALCFYLVNLLKTKLTRPITIRLDSPVVALTDGLDFSYTLESSSRFDAWHRLEFLLLLVFVVAINALVLKVKVNKESSGYMGGSLTKDNTLEMTDSPGDEPFSEKRLVGGHYLDILKISTSSGSPFVVTIGLDHKVMVWSPIADPIPSPFPLPIQSQVWPVVHVVLGNQGNTIALFSKSGLVSCYSRLAQRFIWQVVLEGLKGSVPLESFFRRKTIPAFLQRKMLLEKQKKLQLELEERERSQLHRTTSDQSFLGASIRAERLEEGKDLELMELTVMAKNGAMYTISCDDGKVSEENITSSKALVSARRLTSARVSDRLICQVSNGIIMVATSVNNKWKFRKLLVQEEKYNKGQSLLTPAAMSRHSSVGSKYRPFHVTGSQTSLSTLTPVEPPLHNLTTSTIAIVSFVGMIVRTRDLVAELIDVQTGTLVRKFNIGQFVKNSFRVFHSEPQHCRFCGCASVRSFSLVYTELDTNTVIMHTFSIENRAKNNICWRVERDPRETRCLGFDSVTEQQHWLEGSECWNLTDMNMIVGIVKRKQAAMAVKSETHSSALRSSELRSRRAKPKDSQPVQISDTWEGFTMTATGKVTYHEIPCVPGLSLNPSLLVKRINQIERFGHKSVVVGFGNIIKILYLGNNDELLEKDDYDTNSPNTRLEGNIRGLSFVNKRRQNGLHNGKAEVSVNFSRLRE